jgi:hypothetical protein
MYVNIGICSARSSIIKGCFKNHLCTGVVPTLGLVLGRRVMDFGLFVLVF